MDEARGAMELAKPVWLERPLTDKRGGSYAFEYAAFPDADAPAGQNPRAAAALADILGWAATAYPAYDAARIDRLVQSKIDQATRLALIRAEADGRVVGFHVYLIADHLPGSDVVGRVVYVHQLGFAPDVWNRGLATAAGAALLDLLDPGVLCASCGHPALYESFARLARERGLRLSPRDDQTPQPIYDLARRLNAAFTPTRTLDHRLVRTFDATTSRGTGRHPLLDDALQLGPNQHVFLLALKPATADALLADLAPR